MVKTKIENPSPISIDGTRCVTPEKHWSIVNDPVPVFNVFVKTLHCGFIEKKFHVWYENSEGKLVTCKNGEIINLFQKNLLCEKTPLDVVVYPPGIILFYTDEQIVGTLDMCQSVNFKEVEMFDNESFPTTFSRLLSDCITDYGNIKRIKSAYEHEVWGSKHVNAVHSGKIYFEKGNLDLVLKCDFSSNKIAMHLQLK